MNKVLEAVSIGLSITGSTAQQKIPQKLYDLILKLPSRDSTTEEYSRQVDSVDGLPEIRKCRRRAKAVPEYGEATSIKQEFRSGILGRRTVPLITVQGLALTSVKNVEHQAMTCTQS
ncbi:hypothetical protein B0T19DRAFT_446012 [Cercophora scortea]|uniref:Uncharacterized protein n=1 Tax=Cercophora scortea TaxID=314031 RepID=A0AAE0I8V6_9PEZI|nr:hypothetical protein B0T19DRAFT_446012 [Cercophora scortea]